MHQIKQSNKLKEYLSHHEIELFIKLQKIIEKLNKITNLTRLINDDDYWISQVYDSLWPFYENRNEFDHKKRFIDIGSGCGFPGIAYAITHPNSEVYLIDSSKKKTDALEIIKNEMDLKSNIFIIQDRIENLAHKINYRYQFDIGTARAVGSPSEVAEYILPILNKTGTGILYCGRWNAEDQTKLEKSLKILKGYINHSQTIDLPANKGVRNVIQVKPEASCPNKYPRKIGKPAKYPLGN